MPAQPRGNKAARADPREDPPTTEATLPGESPSTKGTSPAEPLFTRVAYTSFFDFPDDLPPNYAGELSLAGLRQAERLPHYLEEEQKVFLNGAAACCPFPRPVLGSGFFRTFAFLHGLQKRHDLNGLLVWVDLSILPSDDIWPDPWARHPWLSPQRPTAP